MARKVQARLGLYGVLVLALGVLLWSRLLLVTRPPRVAMAEPNAMLVQPSQVPGVDQGAPGGDESGDGKQVPGVDQRHSHPTHRR
jgi:hypothetical protein